MNEHDNERREHALNWCAACRDRRGPFVYMQSSRQYCQPCASEIRDIMGLLSAGRRHDDLVLA
jgi:hypothetical protein